MKKLIWLSLLLGGISFACTGISLTEPFTPTVPPPVATATPVDAPFLEATSTAILRLRSSEVFCPSDIEAATQAYNDGIDFQENGQYAEAEAAYLQAIELDPGYCDAMDNLGLLLRRQGDVDGAIRWYQRSIEVYPENVVAHQNLGLAYHLQGRDEEALAEYQILVDVDPESPEGYYGVGQSYLFLDRPEEAISYLQRAEAIYLQGGYADTYLNDVHYYLGSAYAFSGEMVLARDTLEPIYPQMSEDPWINYALGVCYLSEELYDLEKARMYILHAQELEMQIPDEVMEAINK